MGYTYLFQDLIQDMAVHNIFLCKIFVKQIWYAKTENTITNIRPLLCYTSCPYRDSNSQHQW